MRCFILILVALLMNGSQHIKSEQNPSKINIVEGEFVDSKGKLFFPWGFNYTNSAKVDLIEDNWDDSVIWEVITDDFQQMKDMGANVVRIHLQYHKFMKDQYTPDQDALSKLKDLVAVAETKELYLLITGLAAYRKDEQPAWYKQLNDRERWGTHKVFWKTIAATVGHSSAVFAYDLMNEPVVSVGCKSMDDCDWLPGEGFGGYHFIQNISRNPENSFAETIKNWTQELTQAIRSVDDRTLITIGFLNLGNIAQFGESLDFISMHIYPQSKNIDASVSFVENNLSNVPLVITETFNLSCSISELTEFLDNVDGKYKGLFGHYLGAPSKEISQDSIQELISRSFFQLFMERNPNKY